MKVAAIQFCPALKSPKDNIAKLAILVRKAASQGAEVVVLPELCTTGYSFMSTNEARPFAESLEWLADDAVRPIEAQHGAMHTFSSLVRELGICMVFGYIGLGETGLYNSQAYIHPSSDGLVYGGYNKLNKWGNDYIWATAGTESPPIFEYNGKKIGLLICRDIRDKATGVKDFYEPGDADFVCFSSNWGNGGYPSVSWMEFAAENETYLVVSNRYGREQNNDFGEGGIGIISPEGKVLCEGLIWSQPCIVYADL